MGSLVATAVVGGVATGIVLPSIGKVSNAFTHTKTVPALALGFLPAQVILLTHETMTRVFKEQCWEARNQIHVYAIYIIDLAAGISTTAVIATLSKTELSHALTVSFAGMCAILVVMGLQGLAKKNDMIIENNELLIKLKIRADQFALNQENPPPPPESPKGQQITQLQKDFNGLVTNLNETNNIAKQMSMFVQTSIASINESLRRVRNKSDKRDEELEKLKSEISKLKAQIGTLEPELESLKHKTNEAASNAKLARIDAGRQRISNQENTTNSLPSADRLPQEPSMSKLFGGSILGSIFGGSYTPTASSIKKG